MAQQREDGDRKERERETKFKNIELIMLSKQPESNVYKGGPMNKDEWFFYCARLQNDETQNTNTSLQTKKKEK